jgi:hypothetical protein
MLYEREGGEHAPHPGGAGEVGWTMIAHSAHGCAGDRELGPQGLHTPGGSASGAEEHPSGDG